MMKEKILQFIQKHDMIQPHETVVVATSGGPDSMALLHFLYRIQNEYNLRLIALTVDHQLRGEASKEDVQYVAKMCENWGIVHEAKVVDVRSYAEKKKQSIQVAARNLRYDAIAQTLEKYNAKYVAMGHHGDDQIETVLMSLPKSTSLQGVLGIPAIRSFSSGYIIRPLLCVTKEMIEQYCEENDISARIDPSNEDLKYERNYVRHTIAPIMKERYPHFHHTLQRYSENVQADEAYMNEQAMKMFHEVCTTDSNREKVSIRINSFNSFPVPLQRRCYRIALDYLYQDTVLMNLSYVHEDLFFQLFQHKEKNKVIDFPQNIVIEKAYDFVYIYVNRGNRSLHKEITYRNQDIVLSNGDVISLRIDKGESSLLQTDSYTYVASAERVQFPLIIRTRNDGDRMTYKGLNGTKKIKDILIDDKVPKHERQEQLLITEKNGEIIWLIGRRKNEKRFARDTVYFSLTYQPFKGHS